MVPWHSHWIQKTLLNDTDINQMDSVPAQLQCNQPILQNFTEALKQKCLLFFAECDTGQHGDPGAGCR
jgi:hypothetical protein